jgi:hypothetical protein
MPRAYFLVAGSNPGPFALWDYTRRARIPLVINDEQPLLAWLSWPLKAQRRHSRVGLWMADGNFGRQPAKASGWDRSQALGSKAFCLFSVVDKNIDIFQ